MVLMSHREPLSVKIPLEAAMPKPRSISVTGEMPALPTAFPAAPLILVLPLPPLGVLRHALVLRTALRTRLWRGLLALDRPVSLLIRGARWCRPLNVRLPATFLFGRPLRYPLFWCCARGRLLHGAFLIVLLDYGIARLVTVLFAMQRRLLLNARIPVPRVLPLIDR